MKHPPLLNETARFTGSLRYYHRSACRPRATWDEWIYGRSAHSSSSKWLQIILSIMAVLALGGIIVGLIVTLR